MLFFNFILLQTISINLFRTALAPVVILRNKFVRQSISLLGQSKGDPDLHCLQKPQFIVCLFDAGKTVTNLFGIYQNVRQKEAEEAL